MRTTSNTYVADRGADRPAWRSVSRPTTRVVAINVVAVADDQLVVLDSFGGDHAHRGFARVVTRVPFHPPYGARFVAWADLQARDQLAAAARRAGRELSTS